MVVWMWLCLCGWAQSNMGMVFLRCVISVKSTLSKTDLNTKPRLLARMGESQLLH